MWYENNDEQYIVKSNISINWTWNLRFRYNLSTKFWRDMLIRSTKKLVTKDRESLYKLTKI